MIVAPIKDAVVVLAPAVMETSTGPVEHIVDSLSHDTGVPEIVSDDLPMIRPGVRGQIEPAASPRVSPRVTHRPARDWPCRRSASSPGRGGSP